MTAQTTSSPGAAYDFEDAVQQWSSPPFDNIGYLSSAEIAAKPGDEVRELVRRCERSRYALESDDGLVRNHRNRWRESLGLDSTTGKRIMDFGCGIGLEALQFARTSNRVVLADIAPDNLKLAERVLALFGHPCETTVLVSGEPPFFELEGEIDIFYSNGVLHHTPRMGEILARARSVLSPEGEVRLMLYSDRAWTDWIGGELPPIDQDIATHPGFPKFVRTFDGVGRFADWYNAEKVARVAGPGFKLVRFEYLTKSNWYCTAILRPI